MEVKITAEFDVAVRPAIDALCHRVAVLVAGDARRGCPNDHVGRTIRVDGPRVYVGSTWSIVEYGTPPHLIRPRGARVGGAQALWWPGAEHPVHAVHHPGTVEYAFMRRALYQRRG